MLLTTPRTHTSLPHTAAVTVAPQSWRRSGTCCKFHQCQPSGHRNYLICKHSNPGSKQDDEVLYGSGQSSDPIHSGTSTTGTAIAQGHSLGHQEEGDRRNEPFSLPNNITSTGTTESDNDPFSRTSAQRPGLSSEVGSTTAIRDGVPGATSGSGLNGTTKNDTAIAGYTGASAYETDRRLDPAGQAAGTTESPVGPSALQTDETTTSTGLTGNTYPDRSVGRSVREFPSSSTRILADRLLVLLLRIHQRQIRLRRSLRGVEKKGLKKTSDPRLQNANSH